MKDPAFLFYDGDAAKDVSHMNRLERGCYFDLIQAQRKFGGYTVEQARKILGKDFNDCWPAIELILSKDENDVYYIEWVRNSIIKRKEHAELQRKRIQDYWDKKKKETDELDSPKQYDGNTVVLPLVNENENENVNEDLVKIKKVKNSFKEEFKKPKPKIQQTINIPEKFINFYSLYPKGRKRKIDYEFADFIKKNKNYQEIIDSNILLISITEQNKEFSQREKQYIPHLSTWLNKKCWTIEIDTENKKPKNERVVDIYKPPLDEWAKQCLPPEKLDDTNI